MSEHFSLRLQDVTAKRLRQRAKQLGAAPRTLAQRHIEEGLRQDEHPLIDFRDGPAGRRASVKGTGLDVWEVIEVVGANDNDIGKAAAYLERPAHLIQAAVNYYGAFREEIDERIAANREAWEQGYAESLAGQEALREAAAR